MRQEASRLQCGRRGLGNGSQPWALAVHLAVLTLCLLLVGCGVRARVTLTKRSGLEQQLLVRAMERAMARLDLRQIEGHSVALELYALTEDGAFAKDFVTAWLEARGVRIVPDREKADLFLKVFALVLGVDQTKTLLGIPEFEAPVVNVPFPEIALYRLVNNVGRVEVQIYAYDSQTGAFTTKMPAAVGQAEYDEYTILILISFTATDLDEPVDQDNPTHE